MKNNERLTPLNVLQIHAGDAVKIETDSAGITQWERFQRLGMMITQALAHVGEIIEVDVNGDYRTWTIKFTKEAPDKGE